ncbi:DNA polymerase III subunit gamma/tau [Lacticigenium naphthae]|uniref:DNA polymerase III subunit gamma/tau n=1 Tax=Lacticigenium naphthae TaxID=515351 RepID=UPI0003FB778C|nr:DNA polymerase III subunit gamma/tau [Lacticigenium naphthae]
MSYQALYRVWRPQLFSDVAGQEAITQTLKNALIQSKTSHAYLFTGPRGTGKTSAAKIFSKAINCPNRVDGEPCNECEICQSITQGKLNDVIEIDAASNNGVEEIRDIREKANYAPTSAEYKVYIIDEVHMLSTGAFNALLKTLEEPPANVIFILATTEPHKIPLTIISRTQRFDFKRIPIHSIIKRMEYILGQEEIQYEEESLPVIARAAEGGMRDALSILDQTISFSQERVSVADAMRITGSLTQELLLDYFQAMIDNDTKEGLAILQSLLAEGKDPLRFVEDVILFSRDILIYQQTSGKEELLKQAKIDEKFKKITEKLTSTVVYEIIHTFNQTQQELKASNHAEIYLEVATVRLTEQVASVTEQRVISTDPVAQTENNDEISNLKVQLNEMHQLIKKLQTAHSGQAVPEKKKKSKKISAGSIFKPNKTAIFQVLDHATKKNLAELREVWPDLMNMLTVTQRAVLKASTPVAASPKGLVVSFQYDILCQKATEDTELNKDIALHLQKLVGYEARLNSVTEEQWPVIRKEYIRQLKQHDSEDTNENAEKSEQSPQEKEKDAGDELVTEAIQLFGQEIVKVKESSV